MKLLRHFPLTLLCVVGTWVLCLIPADTIQVRAFSLADKLVHAAFYYCICSAFWLEYARSGYRWSRSTRLLAGLVAPILMSGLIEICQQYLTASRYGDVYDFIANSVGALLSLVLYRGLRRRLQR